MTKSNSITVTEFKTSTHCYHFLLTCYTGQQTSRAFKPNQKYFKSKNYSLKLVNHIQLYCT